MGYHYLVSSIRAMIFIVWFSLFSLVNQAIAQIPDSNIEYVYDKFGRLEQVTYVENQVTYTFGYDKSGNRNVHNVAGHGGKIRLIDTRVLEGNALSFEVILTRSGLSGVSFNWEVFTPSPAPSHPATAGIDFQASPAPVTFPVGAQSATITISTDQDTAVEFPEEVHVRLTDSTIVPIDPNYSEGVGVIRDDDGVYFNVSNATVMQEGQFVDLTIQRQGQPLSGPIDVVVTPTNFEAISGADFDPVVYDTSNVALVNNTITFTPSDTTKTIRVATVDDPNYEADERFYVDFTWVANGIDGWERADITIPNDDPIPTLKIGNGGNREGWDVGITVWSTGDSYLPITVVMDVQDTSATNTEGYDSATAGVDYDLSIASVQNAPAGSLQVSGTQLTYTVPGDDNGFVLLVPTTGDTDPEPFEAFYVKLISASITLPDGTNQNVPIDGSQFEGRGRIRDDDSNITMSIGNAATAQEGSTISFPVTLSAPAYDVTTATWTIVSGDSGDYTASSGTVEIQPNETSATIQIPLVENDQDQPNRVMTVDLSSPVNATLGTSSAAGQVNDDDGPPIINIFNNGAPEGNSTNTLPMTIFLQGGTAMAVTVTFKTTDGTATAGEDYVAIPDTTVTIQPGSFEHNFNVTILGDTEVESDEYFNVVVVGTPINATTVTTGINVEEPNKGSNGVGNITNDDNYTYSWIAGGWGGYSNCTGQSHRYRYQSVSCRRSDGTNVSGSFCGGGQPPTSQQGAACGYSFSYGTYGDWSACVNNSQSRTRSATCISSTGQTVSTGVCGTPVTSESQTCQNYTYGWSYSTWSNWSACTGQSTSTRSRSKTCKRNPGNTTVSNSFCGSSDPTSQSQSCSYSWHTGNWSPWSCVGVGNAVERTRSVYCRGEPNGVAPDGSCGGGRPDSFQISTDPACGGGF